VSGTPIGVVDTDVGPLLAPIDPWIWPCLVETGRWEPLVGDLVRSLLRPGDLVVNVGAHCGYYTRMAALAGCSVVAYEPAPSNRYLLRLNTADLERVEIRASAVSDEPSRGTLWLSGCNPGDHRIGNHSEATTSTTVDIVRLDDETFPAPRLIITDAQGFDLRILRGARRLIDETRPHLLVEWTPHMLDRDDYPEIDRLLDIGYTATLVEGPHIVINRAADGDVIGDGTGTLHLAP